MDSLSLIKSSIEAELGHFDEMFKASLISSNLLLHSALEKILESKGKCMRPILSLLTARLCGDVNEATYHAAVSLELLHTASLVHDDVVDESDQRRGKPSLHVAFNNKVAVLVGDYLLASSLVHSGQTLSHEIIRVISNLGRDLADGELLQLSNVQNMTFSEDVYFEIIEKKTAALFAACTTCAAYSVDSSFEIAEKARQLGNYIGLCFQIKDDIFDYYSDPIIGKPTGNDMHEGKLTLPVIFALNHADNPRAVEIARKIKIGDASNDEIDYLVDFTKKNGGIDYAIRTMHDLQLKAKALLSEFPHADIIPSVEAYIDLVVDRQK